MRNKYQYPKQVLLVHDKPAHELNWSQGGATWGEEWGTKHGAAVEKSISIQSRLSTEPSQIKIFDSRRAAGFARWPTSQVYESETLRPLFGSLFKYRTDFCYHTSRTRLGNQERHKLQKKCAISPHIHCKSVQIHCLPCTKGHFYRFSSIR